MLPQPVYACILEVITLVGPTKVSIMKLICTVLNRMWQHDLLMKQIFFSSTFSSENTGRLAKQAGYQVMIPDTHGISEVIHKHTVKEFKTKSDFLKTKFRL